MNHQEIFTKVATHLLAQGVPAKDTSAARCFFRKGDLKCAVGALIPDEEYFPEMEELGAIRNICYAIRNPGSISPRDSEWINRLGPVFKGIVSDPENEDLLGALQAVHDNTHAGDWRKQLAGVAENYSLEMVA